MKPSCLLYLLLVISSVTHAQSSLNAGGGDASGSTGSLSQSFGQVFFQVSSDGNISTAEGVQQAFDISTVTFIPNLQSRGISCKAYPNPTADILRLSIEEQFSDALSYQVSDMKGKVIMADRIVDAQTELQFQQLPQAAYILYVFEHTQLIKSFKIIKH